MHAEHIVHRAVFFQFSKLRRKWTCFNNIFPPLRPTQDMAQCQNVSKMEVKRTVFLSHISHITQQNGRKPVFWQAGLAHGKITHPLWDRLWEYLLSDSCFLYFLCSFDAFSTWSLYFPIHLIQMQRLVPTIQDWSSPKLLRKWALTRHVYQVPPSTPYRFWLWNS